MPCGMYITASDLKDLCNMRNQQPPVKVSFNIRSAALIYDIENIAYVSGDLIPDTEQPLKHQLIDVAQDGNIDILSRALDLAYSECENLLFPYVETQIMGEDYGDNMLSEDDERDKEYGFSLNMPADFSHATAIYLKKLIHEYMKCRALVEWTRLVYPQLQPTWDMKLEEVRSEIRKVLNYRCGKVRRKLHPFG